LLSNQTSSLPLQQTSAFGIVIAYTITAFAYYQLLQKIGGSINDYLVSRAAFITCMLFVSSCAASFFQTGLQPLLMFITILIVGSCMFMIKHKENI
ncbi:MAG: hypothetical protein JO129_04615, partial [Candidatus Dependentiae bacterium]|nr:hypothetical protein [Candidatus Dependentiae bacterium]